MGMHSGLLAATATRDELLAELNRYAGDFTLGDDPEYAFVIKYGPERELWQFAVGEQDGKAFLFDPNFTFASDPDLLTSMSGRLGTVVGGMGESVSGTYALTVAQSGELRRYIFVCHSGMTREFGVGTPLAIEEEEPIDHPWGNGIFAAFAALDFDASSWMEHGHAVGVVYTAARRPEAGPVARACNEHYQRFARPKDEWLNGLVIVAGDPDDESPG